MPLASSSRLAVRYVPEAVFGTLPGATANYPRALRIVGESLNYGLKKDWSKEIRPDRNVPDLITVDADVGGSLPAELSFAEYDDLLQAGLMGTWNEVNVGSGISATITLTTTLTASAGTPFAALAVGMRVRFSGFTNAANNTTFTILTVSPTVLTTTGLVNEGPVTVSFSSGGVANSTVTTTATTITASAGTPYTGMAAGQWFYVSGMVNAQNNGWKQCSIASTGTVITCAAATFLVEAGSTNVRVSSSRLVNGTVQRSFSIEQSYGDIVQFAAFRGMNVSKVTIDYKVGSILNVTFDFMGKDQMALTTSTGFTGSVVASFTNDVMNAVTGVQNIMEGGTALTNTFAKALNLVLDNTLRGQKGLGQLGNVGIGVGHAAMTGKGDFYFFDASLYNKFVNNTATSLSLRTVDGAGNGYVITLPKVRYSSGDVTAPAIDNDVMVSMGVQGVYDPTTAASIIIDRGGAQAI